MTKAEFINSLEKSLDEYLEQYYTEKNDDIAEELWQNFGYRVMRVIRRVRLIAIGEEETFDAITAEAEDSED
jgi:hypothetical protein